MNRAVVSLVAVFASFSLLHGGRTDGGGGHYDRSTGEYHYHHGYSAHSHYDMDGDGIVDCPYTFKDNTSGNSNPTPKDYDSFEELSNAKYGKSEESESSDNKILRRIVEIINIALAYITIFFAPWIIKKFVSWLKGKVI